MAARAKDLAGDHPGTKHRTASGLTVQSVDAVHLPHALVTTRRDTSGSPDEALAARGLRRRIALTLPYVMVLPAALERSDLVARLPSRLVDCVMAWSRVQRFELPVETKPWTVSMLWPVSARSNRATAWFRRAITACLVKA